MIRTALLGVGAVARFYVAGLESSAEFRLVVVCDTDAERAATVGPGVDVMTSHDDVLRRDDIDAVVVALPNDLHYAVCRDALSAGMHVCCEKPAALQAHEADELVALAKSRERILFTSFHRRYNRNIERLVRHLASIPAPVSATITYRERIADHADPESWYLDPVRSYLGCVTDNGSNAVDLLHHIFGPFTVVSATLDRDDRGLVVEAEVALISEAGMPATILLDWQYPFGEIKKVVVDLGSAVLEADMLEGFDEFKSSLFHEYEVVLAEFAKRIARPDRHQDNGAHVARVLEAIALSADRAGRLSLGTC